MGFWNTVGAIGNAGSAAVTGYARGRQEAEDRRRAEEDRQRQIQIQAALMALQGINQGPAPQDAPPVSIPMPMGAPAVSVDPTPTGRYQQVGDLYIDHARTQQGRQAGTQALERQTQRQAMIAERQREQEEREQRRAEFDRQMALREQDQQADQAYRNAQLGLQREGLAVDRERIAASTSGRTAPGTPKPVVSSEGERKSAGFLLRAESANRLLDGLEVPGELQQRLVGSIGRRFADDNTKQFDQAALAFAQAVLRKDTGATINDQEIEWITRTYLPQPGDDPATLEQKRRARLEAIEELRIAGGRASVSAPAAAGGDTGGISLEAVISKYGLDR